MENKCIAEGGDGHPCNLLQVQATPAPCLVAPFSAGLLISAGGLTLKPGVTLGPLHFMIRASASWRDGSMRRTAETATPHGGRGEQRTGRSMGRPRPTRRGRRCCGGGSGVEGCCTEPSARLSSSSSNSSSIPQWRWRWQWRPQGRCCGGGGDGQGGRVNAEEVRAGAQKSNTVGRALLAHGVGDAVDVLDGNGLALRLEDGEDPLDELRVGAGAGDGGRGRRGAEGDGGHTAGVDRGLCAGEVDVVEDRTPLGPSDELERGEAVRRHGGEPPKSVEARLDFGRVGVEKVSDPDGKDGRPATLGSLGLHAYDHVGCVYRSGNDCSGTGDRFFKNLLAI